MRQCSTTARTPASSSSIANAGFGYRTSIVDGDPRRWKKMLDINVYGLLLTLKYGVAQLLKQGSGHIVVPSSVAGRAGIAGEPPIVAVSSPSTPSPKRCLRR
jgi:NADP-dependent 3-hydroxy acid dehydrogenase YdfG